MGRVERETGNVIVDGNPPAKEKPPDAERQF
jgi:hypothetical protein